MRHAQDASGLMFRRNRFYNLDSANVAAWPRGRNEGLTAAGHAYGA